MLISCRIPARQTLGQSQLPVRYISVQLQRHFCPWAMCTISSSTQPIDKTSPCICKQRAYTLESEQHTIPDAAPFTEAPCPPAWLACPSFCPSFSLLAEPEGAASLSTVHRPMWPDLSAAARMSLSVHGWKAKCTIPFLVTCCRQGRRPTMAYTDQTAFTCVHYLLFIATGNLSCWLAQAFDALPQLQPDLLEDAH